jgi:hypothetical protein
MVCLILLSPPLSWLAILVGRLEAFAMNKSHGYRFHHNDDHEEQ